MIRRTERRTVLRSAGAVLGGVLLAGCTADGSGGEGNGDRSKTDELGRESAEDGDGAGNGDDTRSGDAADESENDAAADGATGDGWAHKSDAANTSAFTETDGPRSEPTVLWEVDRGMFGGTTDPAFVDGLLLVESPGRDVSALDATDGTERWRTDLTWDNEQGYANVTAGGLVVSNDTCYLGTQFALVAIDVETGEERWRVLESGVDSPTNCGSPTIVDGTAYVQADNAIYALDATDGTKRWRVEAGEPTGFRDRSPTPAVVDGTVYVQGKDERVYAIDAANGDVRWALDEGDEKPPSPTVVGDAVVVGWGGGISVLESADGRQRWSEYTGFSPRSGFAVADGVVYHPPSSGGLYAFDAATGEQRWAVDTVSKLITNPTVTAETIYGGEEDRTYRAYDRATGELRWTFDRDTERQVGSAPIVVDGVCYVTTGAGNVYALTE